jgi:hypothetical protein
MSVLKLSRHRRYRYDRPLVSPHRRLLTVLIPITIVLVGIAGWHMTNQASAAPKQEGTTITAVPPLKQPSAKQLATLSPILQPVKATTTPLGIAAGSSLTSLSQTDLDARLQAISNLGAKWIRFDFDWSLIQPNNASSYNWTAYDRLVTASNKYNLQILGILDYTPGWAHSSSCQSEQCAPSSNSQFATFAEAVSKRYAPQGVHTWEVWNEPNNPQFWQPSADPNAYTQLLQQTYQAIHAQDPDATVLTGGLSPQATTNNSYSPTDFLTAIYKDGGKGDFDAVADHPYSFPLTPSNSGGGAWSQMVNNLRPVMVANGDASKKIWITEFGAPTNGPGPKATVNNLNLAASPYVVDETLQAQELTAALNLTKSYSWAGPFFYYSYQDAGTDTSTNENFFGLVRADGSHKPAYAVFQQAASSN